MKHIRSIKPTVKKYDDDNGVIFGVSVWERGNKKLFPLCQHVCPDHKDCVKIHRNDSIKTIVENLRSFASRLEDRYLGD